MLSDTKKVLPGEKLVSTDEYKPGNYTYVNAGWICPTTIGIVSIENDVLNIIPEKELGLLKVGCVCLLKVTRIKLNQVSGSIVLVENNNSPDSLQSMPIGEIIDLYQNQTSLASLGFANGLIRREDIRLTEVDTLDLNSCFQPGDYVLTRVVSLGDDRTYLLSTAENKLGVIWAKSRESGCYMIPKSWTEMICPASGLIENRKCAKLSL